MAVSEVTPAQHFTQPPPRYSEATLIKALEELGIGRPSTYAATISTIVDRGYVEVRERRLYPTAVGAIVTDLLVEHFGDYVDFHFTARMEEELDEVASGQREWVPLLRDFYGPFKTLVDEKRAELKRSDFTTEETDEVCSEGHPMVIRLGRNGRFLACSTYPDHKETRPLPGEEPEVIALEGRRRDLPHLPRGHPGRQAWPFRGLRRLLPLPRLQLHPQVGSASARSVAVRGDLPQVRAGHAHGATRAAHRDRLLGLLALPQVRLHHLARAAGRAPRRRQRTGGPQCRGGHLPALWRRHRAARADRGRARCWPAGRPTRRPSHPVPAAAVPRVAPGPRPARAPLRVSRPRPQRAARPPPPTRPRSNP